MKARNLIRLAVWSLLAGALVNALIAQGIGLRAGSIFSTPGTERFLPIADRCVCVADRRGTGWRDLRWHVQDVDGAAFEQHMYVHNLTDLTWSGVPPELHPDSPTTLPAWARFWDTANWVPDSTSSGMRRIVSTEEFAVGWPALSFKNHADGTVVWNKTSSAAGFIWRPIFPGVLWGSLFWAAPCALLIAGTRQIVRAHRRRRWQCPTCRYDLRGLASGAPCPECGTGATVGGTPM